jgi:hypothetical protein
MSDLTQATRELFMRSLLDEVHMRTPVVEELQRRHKVTHKGGKYIERLVSYDNLDSLAQEYGPNDALTNSSKNILDKPRFTWKRMQLPLQYGVEEYEQNIHAGREEQLLDLADFLVDKGQEATRLWLCAKIFNSGSATGVADGSTSFQSLVSALDHDVTYGTLTRNISAGTRDWFQGCDPSGLFTNVSSSAQATATNFTISNIRKWISETDIAHYDTASGLYICVCPKLYNKIRAEMEAKVQYNPAKTQRQGVTKMYLDENHQIVSVPYLGTTSTMQTWVFILNLNHFELRINANRPFNMTGFKWQGDIANGHDYWLARIMVSGNLVCWKPNSSMWLSNVS